MNRRVEILIASPDGIELGHIKRTSNRDDAAICKWALKRWGGVKRVVSVKIASAQWREVR